MKKFILTLVLTCILCTISSASEAVSFKLNVFQIDKALDNKVLIYADTVEIEVGKNTTGFIGPFSIDIELLQADSIRASFNTHIITLGTSAHTYSKSFTAEYGLPARIEKIICKNESEYLLTVSPLTVQERVETYCNFDHHLKSDFTGNPTANTEIYFVPATLSDFYWDSIKELLESNYVLFRSFLNLNIPGKFHIYVPPCPIHSVIWDKRFGTAVDPTKSSAFAIYNKEYCTVDPFIINHTVALKTFGYTSPFLSEGLANYFSFAIYEMKKIVKAKTNIPMENLLDTYAYLNADASIADRMSTTFVRYLIDAYTLQKFLDLYEKTDDINLADNLQKIYGKSVADLEQEWLTYVDTFTIPIEAYQTYARTSEMMLKYDLMQTYYLAYFENARTSNDTLRSYLNLKRSSFFNGNYYDAVSYQEKFMSLLPDETASNLMVLGSYALMVGDTAKAFLSYSKAYALDSSSYLVKFNLANYYKTTGNIAKAKELLLSNFSTDKGVPAQGETRILLGDILLQSQNQVDKKSAVKYYTEAVSYYKRNVQANNSSPSAYMWLGKAYIGLEDYDNAITYLSVAKLLESRPFYTGMIELYLGQAYYGAHDIKQAENYLLSVVSQSSAVYHQNEAKKLLERLKK